MKELIGKKVISIESDDVHGWISLTTKFYGTITLTPIKEDF